MPRPTASLFSSFLLLGLFLLLFSLVQSGCTEGTASSQASAEPTMVASASVTKPATLPLAEQSVQSDLVTILQPAELLELLPLAKTTPVLIDFTSEYCGECQAIAPVLAAAKKRYTNKVTFMMIDVQKMMDAPDKTAGKALMMAFRPMYTPTLIAVKPGGIVVAVETGFKTSPQLDAMLNGTLVKTKLI
jgi:thiol-disulfide isomerase/thioredoxin